MVEQRTHKPRVGGSIPPSASFKLTMNSLSQKSTQRKSPAKPVRNALLERFEKSLASSGLVKRSGQKILIACSGGPDSVALFHLFRMLEPRKRPGLALLHFNHGLRGRQSDADQFFVRRLAREHGAGFFSRKKKVRVAPKESPEEAARRCRYIFFEQAARHLRHSTIATAHTLNDQAETVLMRVLQGTGLEGLCGIRRQMRFGAIRLIRPLLGFGKKELLAFLKENGLKFRSDASNESRKFLRNRIRLDWMPRLERDINPKLIPALARIPEILEQERQVLEDLQKSAWRRVFKKREAGRVYLRRGFFGKLPAPVQFRVLDAALKTIDPASGLKFGLWQTLRTRLGRRTDRISLPRGIDLALTPREIICYRRSGHVFGLRGKGLAK